MTSDQARQRAENSFKREERAQDGRKAMAEYEAQARAIREKTARLKALRLAKEAAPQTETAPASQRPRRARRKLNALQLRTRASPPTYAGISCATIKL
jgi:hypothetical protein